MDMYNSMAKYYELRDMMLSLAVIGTATVIILLIVL